VIRTAPIAQIVQILPSIWRRVICQKI
jgi:hypothetical protein